MAEVCAHELMKTDEEGEEDEACEDDGAAEVKAVMEMMIGHDWTEECPAHAAQHGRQASPWRPLATHTHERRASHGWEQSRAARASGPKIISARK